MANGPTTQPYVVSDTAPAGITFNGITKSGSGSLGSFTGNASGTPVSWTLATGATNGTYVLTIAATAPAANSADSCHDYINTASVGVVGADSKSANDTVAVTDCTGRIIVGKVNIDGVQSDTFTAHIDGGAGFDFSATTFSAPQTVSAGNHTLSEDAKPGYTAVGWAIGHLGDSPSCGDIAYNADASYPIDTTAIPVAAGQTVVICFVNDGTGKLIINKTDQVGNHDTTWHFTVTGPDGVNQTITGSGSATLSGLPVGGTYSVTEDEAHTGACPVPNEGGAYQTTILDGGSKTITAAGQTISFSFLNQDCAIVASTGNLVINKYGDLNGNHVVDGGESGIVAGASRSPVLSSPAASSSSRARRHGPHRRHQDRHIHHHRGWQPRLHRGWFRGRRWLPCGLDDGQRRRGQQHDDHRGLLQPAEGQHPCDQD